MSFCGITSSVAIATYNGEKYILEQLNSIRSQTVVPDEIVIFDDCSTDGTMDIVGEFSKTTQIKVTFVRNEQNLGYRNNFERAVAHCTGDVVFLCDQDDVWLDHKVETFLKAFAANPDLVYAFSDAYVTDEKLNVTKTSEWNVNWKQCNTRQGFFNIAQTRYFPLGFQAAARRPFLQQILPFLSDHDGWIAQCAPIFGDVLAIPEQLVYYRRHSSTTSQAHKENKATQFELLRKIFRTPYQIYFVYPHAEIETYSKILEYARNRQNSIDTGELEKHLEYLHTIDKAQNKSVVTRWGSLKSLIKNGSYYQYRGNRRSFYLDCLFMLVNSFGRK